MKKLFLFLLMAVSATSVMAQHNDYAAYVIDNDGDTITGRIDLRTNGRMANECVFCKEGESNYVTYKPGEIEGFRFADNGKYYVTRRLTIDDKENLYFAEFLVQGSMNLYYISQNQIDYFFFENADGDIQMIKNNPREKIIDAKRMAELQTDLGKIRYMMLGSNKAALALDGKNMTRENLVSIVKRYHYDVCQPGEDCIQYEYTSKAERYSLRLRAKAGYSNILELEGVYNTEYTHKYSNMAAYEVGIGADIGLDRLLPGLAAQASVSYIKTGGNLSVDNTLTGAVVEYELRANYADVDLGLQYTFGKKGIRPAIRVGVFDAIPLSLEEERKPNGSTMPAATIKWDTFNSHVGGYIGAGILIPCGKHDISLHADYYNRILSGPELSRIAVTAEFVF